MQQIKEKVPTTAATVISTSENNSHLQDTIDLESCKDVLFELKKRNVLEKIMSLSDDNLKRLLRFLNHTQEDGFMDEYKSRIDKLGVEALPPSELVYFMDEWDAEHKLKEDLT